MVGWVVVREMPHRRNPFRDLRSPTYDSSFPTRIVGGFGQSGQSGSRENLMERKRKLDGFEAEPIGNRGQLCPREDSYGRSGGRGMPLPLRQEELRPQSVTPTINSASSTTHSRLPSNQVDVRGQLWQSLPTVENGGEVKRIINIPVVFNDAAKQKVAVKCTVIPEEGIKKSNRALSTERAAVLVQSWYKGHLVRRTEPLVQLHKIHEVKSKLRELQSQMSNVDFIERAQQDNKARLWLTESVMDLLLRLDAVQGVHPCVREIRKAATREVVDCQNAIDSLLSVKDSSISKTTEEMTLDGGISDAATAMEIQEIEPLVNNLNSMPFFTGEEMEHNVASNEGVRRDSVPEESTVRDTIDLTMIDDSRNTIIEPDPDQSSSRSGGEGEVLAVVEMKANSDNGTAPVEVESLREEEGHQGRARDVQTEEGSNSGRNVGDWSKQLEGAHPSTRQSDHDLLRFTTDNVAVRLSSDGRDLGLTDTEVPCHNSTTELEEERQQEFGDEEHAETNNDFQSECDSELTEELGRRQCDDVVRPGPTEITKSNQDEEMHEATSDMSSGLTVNDMDMPIRPAEEKYSSKDFSPVGSPRSPLDVAYSDGLSSMDQLARVVTGGTASEVGEILPEKQSKDQLTKLSEENQALKSLLVGLLKWNQLQATNMQDVNQRLENLESRLSRRSCSNKKKGFSKKSRKL